MMTWFTFVCVFYVLLEVLITLKTGKTGRVDMRIDFPCGIYQCSRVQLSQLEQRAQPCNYFSFCGGGDYVVNFFHFDPAVTACCVLGHCIRHLIVLTNFHGSFLKINLQIWRKQEWKSSIKILRKSKSKKPGINKNKI